jgi:ADP-glucose pyrophosphorylase
MWADDAISCAVLRCVPVQVNAYLFDGYWEDIGTIKSFFEENLKLAAG